MIAFPNITDFRKLFPLVKAYRMGSGTELIDPIGKPHANSGHVISNYCHRLPNCLRVDPTDEVLKYIVDTMLKADRDVLYFELVPQADESVLVLAKYNTIIGSRYLAYVDKNTVPTVGHVWYRQIHSTSWVAYEDNQAIWEETTEGKLRKWLKDNGHYEPEHIPLTMVRLL